MITTIIIDDEDDARDDLRDALAKYCPEVTLIGQYKDPTEGLNALRTLNPELLFLDVQMPTLSGFEILERAFPISSQVIFVSAYDRYAIKAIKFSALDYLLKPVDIDELTKAVVRVKGRATPTSEQAIKSAGANVNYRSNQIDRLAVPASDGIEFFETKDILYCQADDCYTILHLADGKKAVVTRTLKDFEELLSESGFCRIHNSYLINLKHIKRYVRTDGGYVVLSNGQRVDVSRRRKDEFLGMLDYL